MVRSTHQHKEQRRNAKVPLALQPLTPAYGCGCGSGGVSQGPAVLAVHCGAEQVRRGRQAGQHRAARQAACAEVATGRRTRQSLALLMSQRSTTASPLRKRLRFGDFFDSKCPFIAWRRTSCAAGEARVSQGARHQATGRVRSRRDCRPQTTSQRATAGQPSCPAQARAAHAPGRCAQPTLLRARNP